MEIPSSFKQMCALLHQDAFEDYSSRQEFIDAALESVNIEEAGIVVDFLDHMLAEAERSGDSRLRSIWKRCNSDWHFLDAKELKILFQDFRAGLNARLRGTSG